jgi:hypothetical protein
MVTAGDWQTGDMFLLCTDALARWFLTQHVANRSPWLTLSALQTQADFADFVMHLRREGSIEDDDMTLLRVMM